MILGKTLLMIHIFSLEILVLLGQESNISVPKSFLNPLKIGSRKER